VIVHLSYPDKFFAEYVRFIESQFDSRGHRFVFLGVSDRYNIESPNCIFLRAGILGYLKIIYYALVADKIILHGLFSYKLNFLFLLLWWLPRKSFWVMWGGDFYDALSEKDSAISRLNYKLKKLIIPRIYGLITYLEGDCEKVRDWYGARGRLFFCFAYLSNIYRGVSFSGKMEKSNELVVLVGNSSDPSNCHEEVFTTLAKSSEKFTIICPLSYGDKEYGLKTEKLGRSLFGERFRPLVHFMPLDEYMGILGRVDVAIFAHRRQQAMGNTIQLLGEGKKLIIRKGTSQERLFSSLGVEYETLDNFELTRLSLEVAQKNHQVVKRVFSEDSLAEQWRAIFEAKP
jgi:dTDP-N-acetylfucosamine:lipid II N-acetylfucosaminyltransferase